MSDCKSLYNINLSNRLFNKFIKFCYNILNDGENILKNTKINIDIVNNNNINKISTRWVPKNIVLFLNKNRGVTYKVTCNINSINVIIYYTFYERIDRNTILYYTNSILLVIYLLTINSYKVCAKNIEINLYLTPFKKIAPDNFNSILGINEINSGYSSVGCKKNTEIIIYRKEEWFKVLIHELMHNLNLDFAIVNIDESKEMLYNLLNLNIKYEITETYVETWARIINIAIAAKIKTDIFDEYTKQFKELLYKEIIFSLQQATKILKFVNNTNNYRENTNAYAYYVFTSALLYDYHSFLDWCYSNNISNIFDIKKNSKTIKKFTELIISSLKNNGYQKAISCVYNLNSNNSLRMSRFDLLQ